MKTVTKTRKAAEPKFENRVRFNWGYHDAANAVKNGWNNPERNFGFGPALKVVVPEDVVEQHSDKEYAQGWQQGYFDATDGSYEGDSTKAWDRCIAVGTVKA